MCIPLWLLKAVLHTELLLSVTDTLHDLLPLGLLLLLELGLASSFMPVEEAN